MSKYKQINVGDLLIWKNEGTAVVKVGYCVKKSFNSYHMLWVTSIPTTLPANFLYDKDLDFLLNYRGYRIIRKHAM